MSSSFWQSRPPTLEAMLLQKDGAFLDRFDRPELLSYLPSFENKTVLDLAAGIGRFTGEFAKTASHVTAVDLTPHFLEQNQKANSHYSNISYHLCNALEAQFDPASFDLIFISWLLMYLEEEELSQLAPRLASWLKKGGHLFFRESCAPTPWTRDDFYRAHYRPPHFYRQLMDPLLTLVQSSFCQTYLSLCTDPYKHFWIYTK